MDDDELLRYLMPPAGAAPASPTPFNLAEALGLTPKPIGAPPSLGVGPLSPPYAATPAAAPPPTLSSMMPQQAPAPAATPAAPRGGGGPGGLGALQAMERQGVQREMAGIDAEAAAKGKVSQTIGSGQIAAAQEQRQRMATDAQADAIANAAIADRRKQLYAEVDAIGNSRVDPGRLVDNMSTMQKIIGAISLGLGGYAAAKTGGQNAALSIIQKQIDNDIAAQTSDRDNRRGALNSKMTLMQQEIADGHDAADARHKATIALYDIAIKEVNGQAAMLGTALAKAEGDKLAGGLLKDLAGKDKSFWLQQQQLALAGANNDIARRELALHEQNARVEQGFRAGEFSRQLGKDATEASEHAQALALKRGQGGNPERAIALAPVDKQGTPFVAPYGKDEQVTKVNEQLPEIVNALHALDTNIALAQEYSRVTDPLKLGKIAQTMSGNVAHIASVAHAMFGRVNEQELEMVLKAAGDPFALVKRLDTMKQFRENIRSGGQTQLESIGYKGRWDAPETQIPLWLQPSPKGFNAPKLFTERDLQNKIIQGRTGLNPDSPWSPDIPDYVRKQYPVMKRGDED